MKLTFEGLELSCEVVAPAAGTKAFEDWFVASVQVRVPGFAGQLQWQVTVGEIDEFLKDLERAYSRIGTPSVVAFESVEPNVMLRFMFNESGQIDGEYCFRVSVSFGPVLRGSFHADQTYVPGVVLSFQSLLNDACAAG